MLEIALTCVNATLNGVATDDIHLDVNQEVIFSHGQHQNQVENYLHEFSEYLRKKA